MLALWLTRLGVRVRIIDRAAEPGTTSRALAVQARTLELYHQVGLADAVIDGGVQVAGINLWVRGERTSRVPLRTLGTGLSPYPFALVYPQDAHERLLIDELARLDVHVERPVELVSFTQSDTGVRATLRHDKGAEEVFDAEYLVGCDGASSIVRRTLDFDFPGGTYRGVFYVADVEATGPAVNDELHVDLEDADFLIVFPMKGKGRIRLVGAVTTASATADTLTFEDLRGKAVDHVHVHVENVNWFSTYHVHHRVVRHFRDRRVFLAGDAAHIHSPVGGQGMNTGIGDAINLAWKLADVIRNGAADRLLDSYEPERMAFARRLVDTTDRVFTFITRQGALARIVRTMAAPLAIPLALRSRFARHLLFRTVSQINVAYPHSPISQHDNGDASGSVHAGDRLPWVPLADGADNFAALRPPAWQVHVYGDTSAALTQTCMELHLPLQRFPWSDAAATAGLARNASYLVRPDGYIALTSPDAQSSGRIRSYMASLYPSVPHPLT